MDFTTGLLVFLLFVLGISTGSFILAMVWRVHNNISLLSPRSRCDKCGHKLCWFELVPLISYWFWRKQCRYCKRKLSPMYFFAELFVGLAFVGIYYTILHQPGCSMMDAACVAEFNKMIGVFLVLFTLGLSDALYMELPDMFTMPVVFFLLVNIIMKYPETLAMSLVSAVIAAGFFAVQWVVSRGRWVGSGDIILGAIIGLLLSWQLALIAIGLGYVLGAAYALAAMAFGKLTKKDRVPLGTFLAIATFAVFWYMPFFNSLVL